MYNRQEVKLKVPNALFRLTILLLTKEKIKLEEILVHLSPFVDRLRQQQIKSESRYNLKLRSIIFLYMYSNEKSLLNTTNY